MYPSVRIQLDQLFSSLSASCLRENPQYTVICQRRNAQLKSRFLLNEQLNDITGNRGNIWKRSTPTFIVAWSIVAEEPRVCSHDQSLPPEKGATRVKININDSERSKNYNTHSADTQRRALQPCQRHLLCIKSSKILREITSRYPERHESLRYSI